MLSLDRIIKGSERSRSDLVLPEENLPLGKTLALGLQHVLAMFGATVLAPILMGFDPSLAVFFSGLGTMLFLIITRGRIPSYLGSSFAFIGPVLAAGSQDGNLSGALFGILCAAVVYAVIGLIVVVSGSDWIQFLMPPIVTGAVVMVIGLNLANVAGGMFMTGWPLALITILAAVLIAVYTRGFTAMLPILLGVAVGYFVALLNTWLNIHPALGTVDTSAITSAAWFGVPNFVTPVIDWNAAFLIAPVAIVLVAENTGHVKAISGNMGRKLDPYLGHAFLGDAAGTALSAVGGGTGQTTYAENIGVMAMTRVYSIAVFVVASITAVLLGFIPKFAAVIQSIPVAVMGGISLLLFGLIAATGGRIWVDGKVDFSKQRNLVVGGVTIVIGAINIAPQAGTPFAFNIGGFELSGIALATLVAIVLNQLLAIGERREEAREAGAAREPEPAAPGVADAQPETTM
jgi:uracil-xanthine permease